MRPSPPQVFVSGGADGEVHVHSMLQAKPIRVLETSGTYIFDVKWSRVRPMVLGEEVEAPTLSGCAVTARDLKLSGEGGVDPLLLIERGRKRRGRRELSMPRRAEHIVPLR